MICFFHDLFAQAEAGVDIPCASHGFIVTEEVGLGTSPSEQHTGPWPQTSHIMRPDTRPIETQPNRRKISLQNRGHPNTPRA